MDNKQKNPTDYAIAPKEDIKVLEWDADSGKPPIVGQVIQNYYGDKFEVIARKGNIVTLKRIQPEVK